MNEGFRQIKELLEANGFKRHSDNRWYGHNLILVIHYLNDCTKYFLSPDYNKYPSPPIEKRKLLEGVIDDLPGAMEFFGVTFKGGSKNA